MSILILTQNQGYHKRMSNWINFALSMPHGWWPSSLLTALPMVESTHLNMGLLIGGNVTVLHKQGDPRTPCMFTPRLYDKTYHCLSVLYFNEPRMQVQGSHKEVLLEYTSWPLLQLFCLVPVSQIFWSSMRRLIFAISSNCSSTKCQVNNKCYMRFFILIQ